MAKKTKVVEIKSVPTEPQRGAGEGADPNDPVGIYYPVGGIARLIGSLAGGEEDEAVIKTGGTIVEHDINVRYRAPAAGWTEVVNIEENNVQLSYDAGNQRYMAILPASAIVNPVSGNQFINYEVSGDISLSGKNISYDDGEGITLVDAINPDPDLSAFEVIYTESVGVGIIAVYQEDPASAPSVNIKVSTISNGNSAGNSGSSDPGSNGSNEEPK